MTTVHLAPIKGALMAFHTHLRSSLILLGLALGYGCSTTAARSNPHNGLATAHVETEPVAHSGDAADDPAIWINPADPSQSTIIGTDKKGCLAVYDLAGKQL